jgi:inosine-uridine nucleoside N-ribohydrolase
VPILVIVECDPGTDDALAILLALASPELTVLGITVAAGNVGLDHTPAQSVRPDHAGWLENSGLRRR